MRRIPARFPEERPRGPRSIKSRVKEMTEAGSGSDRGSTGSYGLEASILQDASAGFCAELLRSSVRAPPPRYYGDAELAAALDRDLAAAWGGHSKPLRAPVRAPRSI